MYFFCYQKPRFQNNIIISVSPAVYLFSTSILIDVIQWWVILRECRWAKKITIREHVAYVPTYPTTISYKGILELVLHSFLIRSTTSLFQRAPGPFARTEQREALLFASLYL